MDAYVIVQGHYVENDKPGLFVLEALPGSVRSRGQSLSELGNRMACWKP